MKKLKSILLIALAVAGCATTLYAGHWRVSNVPGASAQYTSVQAAHDAALVLPGDTLYIEPSGTSYGDLNWSKQLVVIGNGYLLSANPETQANTATSWFGTINIFSTASSSFITGCNMNSFYINDNVQNIFFKRNWVNYLRFYGSAGAGFYIIQNYIGNIYSGNSYYANVSIENNIITNLSLNQNIFALILNNVITGNLTAFNSTFKNNIHTCNPYYSGCNFGLTNCNTYNNISAALQFGTDNGNLSNVDMNTVFVCFSDCGAYSADGRYQLKAGSVAAGAGVDGVDCGAFDGDYPYVLSGIPTIPAIYSLKVLPQGDSLNVSVKIKSHN